MVEHQPSKLITWVRFPSRAFYFFKLFFHKKIQKMNSNIIIFIKLNYITYYKKLKIKI